jgi:hypothetical protein
MRSARRNTAPSSGGRGAAGFAALGAAGGSVENGERPPASGAGIAGGVSRGAGLSPGSGSAPSTCVGGTLADCAFAAVRDEERGRGEHRYQSDRREAENRHRH